ncbi:MAG: type II toxin-antitoxin system MqsR family toxin [Xanthobacteraceae bacterium]
MVEKKTPHHDLDAIKSAFSNVSSLIATGTAIKDAAALGYGRQEIVDIIQTIAPGHFYKSMTSNYDNKVWQDVYHSSAPNGVPLYVKFTDNGRPGFLLLSFKEK